LTCAELQQILNNIQRNNYSRQIAVALLLV